MCFKCFIFLFCRCLKFAEEAYKQLVEVKDEKRRLEEHKKKLERQEEKRLKLQAKRLLARQKAGVEENKLDVTLIIS